MKCPACGKGYSVYKCNNCGDARCNMGGCPGTMGGTPGSTGPNFTCKVCRKGKYIKIS